MSESLGDILAPGRHTVLMKVRPNTVLAITGLAVVVLALVAALLSGQRQRSDFDEATPEGVAQLYVISLIRGDGEQALQLMDPALGCSTPLDYYAPPQASIALVDSEIQAGSQSAENGTSAKVVLEITETEGGFSTWSHRETLELRQVEGDWRITGEPWPIYNCE